MSININLTQVVIPNPHDQPDPHNLKFLTRSILERNDKEISAINKCNLILHSLKHEIGERDLLLYYCQASDFVKKKESKKSVNEDSDDESKDSEDEEMKLDEVKSEDKQDDKGIGDNEMNEDKAVDETSDETMTEEKVIKEEGDVDKNEEDEVTKALLDKSNLSSSTLIKIAEFEEYMTLRRRLLNRLSRRLNRVSRCADGELSMTNPNKYSILPPPLPKYGQLRHVFETNDLSNYALKKTEREEIENGLKEAITNGDEEEMKRYKEKLMEYETVIPLEELAEEDEEEIVEPYGNGINVQQRNMTTREKVLEYQRYQNDMASCLLDQPSFKDLGMMNAWNVQKRLLNNGEESKIDTIKRFSIASTPSFHTQDLSRIYSTHTDMVEQTLTAKIQATIQEATTEFEKANAISQELFNRKLKYETELQNLQSVPLQHAIQKKQEVAMQWALAKSNFTREANAVQQNFDSVVVANTLSNIRDRVVLRFSHVPRCNDYNLIRNTVSSHLNQMLQTVTYQVETAKKYEQFIPTPQLMEAATIVQNQDTNIPPAQEAEYKAKINDVQNMLRLAEEERRKAWKKLQKVKADLLTFPNEQVQPKPKVVQPVRSPTVTIVQPTINAAQQVIQNTSQQLQQGQLDVKYSAESVKARCYPDGSVMPVSLPKRNKDGLFQRPAGRKRKGMDWDAVRGRWMPAPGYTGEDD